MFLGMSGHAYSALGTDLGIMIKGVMNIKNSSLRHLSITNIEQAALEPLTRMLLYPKVSIGNISIQNIPSTRGIFLGDDIPG